MYTESRLNFHLQLVLYRDNFGRVQHTDSKAIGDCHPMGEVVAICEAILTTT